MDSPASTFAAHAARGELAYQVDAEGRPLWPPSVRGAQWRVSSGAGTVYATTTLHRRGEQPYEISLVDLDEGFRIMSRVRGGGEIGARVRVVFADGTPEFEVQA